MDQESRTPNEPGEAPEKTKADRRRERAARWRTISHAMHQEGDRLHRQGEQATEQAQRLEEENQASEGQGPATEPVRDEGVKE